MRPNSTMMSTVAETNRELPIISVPPDACRNLEKFFPQSELVLGAGRKPLSNGGPPGARLGGREARASGWAVAHVGGKPLEKRGTWRAEVGAVLPGDCARPLRCVRQFVLSVDCLLFPALGDVQAQR